MDDKQTATAAAARGSTPVRNWTEEEKDVVWRQATEAKAEGLPLTEAFRRCAKLLPHRSEAAIGMLYYNVLRKERERPTLTVKKTRSEFVGALMAPRSLSGSPRIHARTAQETLSF